MKRSTAFIWAFLSVCAIAACENSTPPPTAPSVPQTTPSPAPPPPPPPPSPPADDRLVGSYNLAIDARSNCTNLPAAAVSRRYAATITSRGGSNYLVTLDTGTFLNGLICTMGGGDMDGIGCHQFLASRNGDTVQFDLVNNNDNAHGGHIDERLEDSTWIELIGTSTGQLRETTIEARGQGNVWYCPTPMGYPFPCWAFTSCKPDDLKLTFTRR
jgi:hypothetical protein